MNNCQYSLPGLQAACAHLSRPASCDAGLRRGFYLSWCSWCPRGLGRSRPRTPRSESPRCGTGSRGTPRSPACRRWVTARGPRSRCIYTSRRCCRSCSSRCHTDCSSGRCTPFCICHTSGQFHRDLKNTERNRVRATAPCRETPAVGSVLWGLTTSHRDKYQQPASINQPQILS